MPASTSSIPLREGAPGLYSKLGGDKPVKLLCACVGYNGCIMARLPTTGGDAGAWGDVLNTYLQVGHDSAGVNKGPLLETSKSANYTLAATDNGTRIVATAALTVTVPAVGTLGNGFECELINDSGGSVTIDGPGAANVVMSNGDIATILEFNSKQRVASGAGILIS